MTTAIAHSLQINTLKNRPTIETRGCCELKLEDEDGDRWWLCRLATSDHRITIERYRKHLGGWYKDQVFVDKETES